MKHATHPFFLKAIWSGLRAGACLGLASSSGLAGDAPDPTTEIATIVVVAGVAGDPAFSQDITDGVAAWETAARRAQARCIVIGTNAPPTSDLTDRAMFEHALRDESKEAPAPLWLVLLGHGTFDGREAKFNLRGPDVSASDLAQWIQPFQRPVLVMNLSSSSAPFVQRLSAPGRVVVTATRSGHEQNYSRFGKFMSELIADTKGDLDHDGQTSVLEAFLAASAAVAEFYKSAGRLATEHPIIDDNGDGRGTPSDWFRGLKSTKKAADGSTTDGPRAHRIHLVMSAQEAALSAEQRERRDELEAKINELRESKSSVGEDEYYARLEAILLDLARLYQSQSSLHPPRPSIAAPPTPAVPSSFE